MRSLSRVFLFCLAFSTALASGRQYAPAGDYCMYVRTDWHLAAIAEFHGDWQGAISYYQKVIDESAPLNIYVREWYRGTAGYGIARNAARLNNAARVRSSLTYAFEH